MSLYRKRPEAYHLVAKETRKIAHGMVVEYARTYVPAHGLVSDHFVLSAPGVVVEDAPDKKWLRFTTRD